jgi:hypothetical protein
MPERTARISAYVIADGEAPNMDAIIDAANGLEEALRAAGLTYTTPVVDWAPSRKFFATLTLHRPLGMNAWVDGYIKGVFTLDPGKTADDLFEYLWGQIVEGQGDGFRKGNGVTVYNYYAAPLDPS